MNVSRPGAILFDLDGTLIDSAVQIAAALSQVRALRGGGPLDARKARAWISLGASQLVARALEDYTADPITDVAEFRAAYGALAPDPADLYPGAVETLALLGERGWRVAVCTAKPEALARRVIDGTGLAAHVLALVGGRDGLADKPDPAPARLALSLLGAGVEDAVYVGDSEVDAATAKAAGLPFLLATYGYAVAAPHEMLCAARFDDLRDVPDLAEGLRGVPLPSASRML